jgi:ribonuclease HI
MIVANFDGSCDPNPGGICTYGFIIWRESRKLTDGRGVAAPPGPGATSNVAEYFGAIRALEWLRYEKTTEPIVLRGDSQLVLRQLQGIYKVRSPLLAPLYWRTRELLGELPSVRLEWVPRERNVDADRIAAGR